MVFDAAPNRTPRKLPQVIPGTKPVDILKRKSGQCAAIVKSKGLVHWCCGVPTGKPEPMWVYCEAHDPQVPLQTSPKEFTRGLRRYIKD
jgi:hypothetical protein